MLDILEIAREDGMEKGMQKGTLKMAKAFKEKGVDIKIISDTAGIPLEKVERL